MRWSRCERVAGISDSADLDESVDAATSIVGVIGELPPQSYHLRALIVRIVPPYDAVFPLPVARSPLSVRAPPTL
jgi:hypothetical protein